MHNVFLGFLVLALVSGAMFHSWRIKLANEKYHPAGEQVDVGGSKVHYLLQAGRRWGRGAPCRAVGVGRT